VLDRGEVVQRGTERELMAVDGLFRRLAATHVIGTGPAGATGGRAARGDRTGRQSTRTSIRGNSGHRHPKGSGQPGSGRPRPSSPD
jgi:hypothetical protein